MARPLRLAAAPALCDEVPMHRNVVVGLLVASFALLLLAGAQCFPRQCRTHEHCLRVCECEEAETEIVIECPFFFRCERDTGTCESDYSASCSEICQRYAGAGLCGSKKCTNEAECVRSVLCQAQNQQTGEVSQFGCELPFACNQDVGACEAGFAADDNTICQACASGQ